jgi:hypothetical protein
MFARFIPAITSRACERVSHTIRSNINVVEEVQHTSDYLAASSYRHMAQ